MFSSNCEKEGLRRVLTHAGKSAIIHHVADHVELDMFCNESIQVCTVRERLCRDNTVCLKLLDIFNRTLGHCPAVVVAKNLDVCDAFSA